MRKSESKTRLLAWLGITLLARGAVAETNLVVEPFTVTGSTDFQDVNFNLANRQSGLLAPMAWAGTSSWQRQVGNNGFDEMLLAGAENYLGTNFAAAANAADKPLVIRFDGKVADAGGDLSTWFSFNLSASGPSGYGPAGTFCALFRANGGGQIFSGAWNVVGSPNWSATNVLNQFRPFTILFSDTAGTGSAFNGKGSVAKVYAGNQLLGSYSLGQLSAAYLGFGGNWQQMAIDNVQISIAMTPAAAPVVTGQPQSRTNYAGSTATFAYNVLGLGLQYQWYQSPGTLLPGATNRVLTLDLVSAADAGNYFAIASGPSGSRQSSNATLTVLAPPQTSSTVQPDQVLVDNFEGWGTSLCWWANVIGGYSNRSTFADLIFTNLQFNIVRYNIGGGENPGITNTLNYRAQMPGFQPSPGVWNWNADANQRWMLRAAVARGANRIVAFANSPPWWMTVSGSVTGSADGTSDNLQTGQETAFAQYLATVVSNLTVLDGVTFDYVTPMNEPLGGWWVKGGSQEGCHMSAAQQNRVVNLLRTQLDARQPASGIAASEDTSQQSTINSLNAYDAAGQSNVDLVASHTYNADNPAGLRSFAQSLRRPLWISEYGDGDASGLTMARRIRDHIAQTYARAWIYWQVSDGISGWALLCNVCDASGNTNYWFNPKFFVMAQFSRFIRPGAQILKTSDDATLAAYDPIRRTLTLVAVNDSTNVTSLNYNLGAFNGVGPVAARWRTAPGELAAPLVVVPVTNAQFTAYLAPQSVTTHVISNVFLNGQPCAWYPLDGNAQDVSGNGLHATALNNVAFVPGKIGAQAAQFNGSNAFAVLPRSVSNSFSLALWVRTTNTAGGNQWWAGKGLVDGEVAGAANDFGLALVGGQAGFGAGTPDLTITSTVPINDGSWHHLLATRNHLTGEMNLYRDGLWQTGAIGPVGTLSAPPSVRLGGIQAGYPGGFFNSALDDVKIFDRVLNATEVAGIMNRAPSLAAPGNYSIVGGSVLLVTNSASDPDQPGQSLTWSLPVAPGGAAVNATNGLVQWRSAIAQAPSTNIFAMVVADDGLPGLSATQSFTVTVTRPAMPQVSGAGWSNGAFGLRITGDAGPDYIIEAATDLSGTVNWRPVATNQFAMPPWWWTDAAANGLPQRFYRVRLGP